MEGKLHYYAGVEAKNVKGLAQLAGLVTPVPVGPCFEY